MGKLFSAQLYVEYFFQILQYTTRNTGMYTKFTSPPQENSRQQWVCRKAQIPLNPSAILFHEMLTHALVFIWLYNLWFIGKDFFPSWGIDCKRCMVCTLIKKIPFQLKKSPFRPIAVILAMRMSSCFHQGWRGTYLYSAIVQETLAKSRLFIKVTFRPLFRFLKNGISTTNSRCCYITVDPATPAPWNGVSHFGVLLNRPSC